MKSGDRKSGKAAQESQGRRSDDPSPKLQTPQRKFYLLPIVLAGLLYTVNPTMMSLLWTTEIGVKLLWTAGILIVIGGFIIRKIVKMDV